MKDIVNDLWSARLHDPDPWDATVYERAANEIERLSVEIDRLRSLVAVWDDAPLGDRETSDIVSRLRDAERYGQFGRSLLYRQVADEIERLRSEVDVLRVCYDELVLRVDHVDVDGTPSDPFVPVLLAPWVVDVLTDPHASMHQERVESIWLSVVESCERAKGVMF